MILSLSHVVGSMLGHQFKDVSFICALRADTWLDLLPSRDFDPYDLRMRLPIAVAQLNRAIEQNKGTAYIHCTAGLGRAPGVAVSAA